MEDIAFVVLPKVSGMISALCSALVVGTVLWSKKKRSKTYHRLVCGISIFDFLSSVAFGLSTWPMPRRQGALWAAGNLTTCSIQGFFVQTGVASPIYNASLSLYFLLTIRFRWRDSTIKKLEPFLHLVPIVWGLGTAIAGQALGLYGNARLWCWIEGDRAIFRWTFFYGPLWLNIFLVTACCAMIYHHVYKVEKSTARHRFDSDEHEKVFSQSVHKSDVKQVSGGTCLCPDPLQRGDAIAMHPSFFGGDTAVESPENWKHDIEFIPGDQDDAHENDYDSFQDDNSFGRHESDRSTLSVQRQEQMAPRSFSPSKLVRKLSTRVTSRQPSNMWRTKEVARKCFWFSLSFYLTWTSLSISRVLEAAHGRTYTPVLIIAALTAPLQGLPNFLVYLLPQWRPRITRVLSSAFSPPTSPFHPSEASS